MVGLSGITYISPSGRKMDLTAPGDWYRSIAYGGLVGLVGTKSATTVQAAGVPGLTPVAFRTEPMSGELTLYVEQSERGPSVDEAVREIHREFQQTAYGLLVIDRDGAASRLTARVRLNGALPPPLDVEGEEYAELKVPLIADNQLWAWDPVSARGSVTVTNPGDVFMWPELMWREGGKIILPSGLEYTLPAASSTAWASLNPFTSHEVTVAGAVDDALSDALEKMHLGEGVPEGTSRTYTTTGDVSIVWAPQQADPWK